MAKPDAKPEPCLEVLLRVLELILTTTSRPRRREYTTPETATEFTSTETQPTVNGSGESADNPSVDERPSTAETEVPNTEVSPTDEIEPFDSTNNLIPNDVSTNYEPAVLKQKNADSKRKNWWWW